jgi:hypothetical protein
MRLVGAGLLVGGFLLCVSIAWAALGFLMMGGGLICLLVAEERSKRARLVIEPKHGFESRDATRSVAYLQRPPTYRERSLRALYEAVADNADRISAADPRSEQPGRGAKDQEGQIT